LRPNPSAASAPLLYGGSSVNGPWGFDSKGHLLGLFLEHARPVTCTTNVISITTNLVESLNPIAETNESPDGVCITLPVATNLVPNSYLSQQTCYANLGPIFTNIFESAQPVAQTNISATLCITLPIGTNAGAGTFTNQDICYSITPI